VSLHHLVHHLYQPGCGPKETAHQCHQFVTYKVVCVWNPCRHRFEEHIEKITHIWNPCKHRFDEHIRTIKVILNPCKELIKRCLKFA
jgi:hypothetical protein